MKMEPEWWEFRGRCGACRNLVAYGQSACCKDAWIDVSWQSRVNPDNTRWMPGYRFKAIKDSGYRHYNCYYGIDRNGHIEFQGGVRLPPEQLAGIEARYLQERPGSNYFPGCEQ